MCQSRPHSEQCYTPSTLGWRNRIELRTVRLWPLPPRRGAEFWHSHFQTVIEVQRQTEVFNPYCTRSHWSIENRLYHVLDVPLGENSSRIRKNPGDFARLRHFALSLLRHNGQDNVR